jgi:hypothetical protein
MRWRGWAFLCCLGAISSAVGQLRRRMILSLWISERRCKRRRRCSLAVRARPISPIAPILLCYLMPQGRYMHSCLTGLCLVRWRTLESRLPTNLRIGRMCVFGSSRTCWRCCTRKSIASSRSSCGRRPGTGIETKRSCGGAPIAPITKRCFHMGSLMQRIVPLFLTGHLLVVMSSIIERSR